MYFYPGDLQGEQYGTDRREFDDLLECVTTILRLQADHEKQRHGVTTGKTARDMRDVGECDLDDAGPEGSET